MISLWVGVSFQCSLTLYKQQQQQQYIMENVKREGKNKLHNTEALAMKIFFMFVLCLDLLGFFVCVPAPSQHGK